VKIQNQLTFDAVNTRNLKHFGGDFLKNSHAKVKRPISTKKAMHVVVRSTMAKGPLSLLRKNKEISSIIYKQARESGVRIYHFANAGNHLHMVILASSRMAFKNFIRSVTGLIARLILKAQKGAAKSIQFWDKRPFSRILEWGRDFKITAKYLLQNTLEALGFIPYQPRKKSRSLGAKKPGISVSTA
jgi:REP element-mobilizing transposase RayT